MINETLLEDFSLPAVLDVCTTVHNDQDGSILFPPATLILFPGSVVDITYAHTHKHTDTITLIRGH